MTMDGADFYHLLKLNLECRREIQRIARFQERADSAPRSVLIAGAVRSGKTTLAQELRAKHGYYHLNLDRFTRYLVAFKRPQTKHHQFSKLLQQLLTRFPTGLCMEGSLLVYGPSSPILARKRIRKRSFFQLSRDTTLTSEEKERCVREAVSGLQVCKVRDLADHFDVRLFAVGSLETVEEKHQGLLRYRATGKCWTVNAATDDDVYYLAMEIIYTSHRLLKVCANNEICFLNIASNSFAHDVDKALQSLLSTAYVPGTMVRSSHA